MYPNQYSQTGAPLFVLDVDVGGGRKEAITVCQVGAAEAVAEAFVAAHKLPAGVTGKLTALIKKHKEAFLRQQQRV